MKIKDLKEKHQFVHAKAMEYAKAYFVGINNCKTYEEIEDLELYDAFYFDEIDEGFEFGEIAFYENFQPFYDFHNLPNPENEKP